MRLEIERQTYVFFGGSDGCICVCANVMYVLEGWVINVNRTYTIISANIIIKN